MKLDLNQDGKFNEKDIPIIIEIIEKEYGKSGWPFLEVVKKIH